MMGRLYWDLCDANISYAIIICCRPVLIREMETPLSTLLPLQLHMVNGAFIVSSRYVALKMFFIVGCGISGWQWLLGGGS